jgi:hypothetical protein
MVLKIDKINTQYIFGVYGRRMGLARIDGVSSQFWRGL